MVTKDETLEAIIAGAKANGSWDKKYPDDDKKAQPAQEPVGEMQLSGIIGGLVIPVVPVELPIGTKLYTIPPQRPWVGLTDDEMLAIEQNTTCTADESWLRKVTLNIEAKLKEKNT